MKNLSPRNWPLLFIALAVLTTGSVFQSEIDAFLAGGGSAPAPAAPQTHESSDLSQSFNISANRAEHILYGNETGGGHRHGAGIPCKTEFPADWGDDKILGTVSKIAANDNANWRKEPNGYYVRETMIEGVNVRVVLGRDKSDVITAYPTNLPRNPCSANDH